MRKYFLILAWIISCFGTLISIYFSYILKIEPCLLCNYQRICLFPLTIILGTASYYDFFGIKKYVFPLPIIGTFIALYQIILQEIPGMRLDICSANSVSCSTKIYILEPITVPMASSVAFIVITFLLIVSEKSTESKIRAHR
ncbi:MAG: disulfide bond formation protein B [Victivallaceae bacterium]